MPKLFDPITIKGVTLKNRIVMPPMDSGNATIDGHVTDELIAHYVARARGGVGLIIIEHSYVMKQGQFSPKQIGVFSDEHIAGLALLSASIQAEGVPCILQLNHAGARTTSDLIGEQPVSASEALLPRGGEMPRALAKDEIAGIVAAFAAAAVRAKTAGFDGVEIHGAHGFLTNQFTSPITNKRDDEYGGDLVGRMRFALEIFAAVREAVGDEYIMSWRLGADDGMDGGNTIEDGIEMAKMAVTAGVDIMDVSGGMCGSSPSGSGPGYFVPQARAIRQAVSVPVVAVGGITTGEFADDIIRDGDADLVAVGRALLKDAEWVRGVAEGMGL